MFFCNISAWGPQADAFFDAHRDYDCIAAVETHLDAEAAALKCTAMQRWGRRPFWSNAKPSLKAMDGTSGGAVIAPRIGF
jgi:hypothetical protein